MEEQNSWEQPKSIVLGRGRPEEHVLGVCKQDGSFGSVVTVSGCRGNGAQGQGACQGLGQS